MSDEQQPPGGQVSQPPAGGAATPVPRRPRRVRGYAAHGADLSQDNAYLFLSPVVPDTGQADELPDDGEAAGRETPADGTA